MREMHKQGQTSNDSDQSTVPLEECWHGEEELRSAVRSWATHIGVQQPKVRLQAIPKVWATMDVEQVVMNLAAEVVTIPKWLGEYIIIHELVHLLVPQAKHGRLFKLFLDCYMPNWREREARLQLYAHKVIC